MKNSMKKLLACAVLAMAALSGTAYADPQGEPPGLNKGGDSTSTSVGVGVGVGVGIGGSAVGIGGSNTNFITDNSKITNTATGGAGGNVGPITIGANTANGGAGGQGGAGGRGGEGGSSFAIGAGGEGGKGYGGQGGSARQGQGQDQGQEQRSENNNDNSSNAKANAGNGSGNSTVNTNVTGSTTIYPRQTQSAHAAGLSVSNGTCMGSTSGAAQGPGFGISIGGTWNDDNCNRRYNAQLLDALGQNVAAVALLCQDVTIREAMEVAGTPCIAKPSKVAVLNVPAKPEVTDKYVRARAGLPPLPEAPEAPVTNPQSD